ncbi:MAG: acyl-CoA desaturase [Phycisphaerales bacterium]|nr:MAG: acyl-CoA desaturase [Phycisphaerales bacterium]
MSNQTQRLQLPSTVMQDRILWRYAVVLVVMHALALLAVIPWLFTWTGLIACVVGVFFFGQGINFCYHRLLTHRSFVVPKWLERFWVVIALCCLEDTPCKWVTTHRHHHKHSDHEDDPHSPLVTFLWSHFQWVTRHNTATRTTDAYHYYTKDILSDPFYMALEKRLLLAPMIFLAHAALFLVAGYGIGWWQTGTMAGALQMGLSLLVWGVFLRVVLVWHITWSVNSLTHTWGYRNHDTPEHSRNNWIVALLAVGEGWHNNHHHDQASASNQHRWWEIDLTYYHIALLKRLGLARKVVAPKHIRRAAQAERRLEAAPQTEQRSTADAGV